MTWAKFEKQNELKTHFLKIFKLLFHSEFWTDFQMRSRLQ